MWLVHDPLYHYCKVAKFPLFCQDLRLSVEVKGRISSFVSLDLKLQMHRMATLQKRSLSNRTNPTVTVCSDGFRLYFLWRLNPNTSFHLFSFPRSVHFGILSGLLIVLRGVSLCEIFPLPKTTECGKRWGGLPTLAFLDFHPSLLQLMWLQAGPGQFSLPLSSIELCILFFPLQFHMSQYQGVDLEWMIFAGMNYIFSPRSSSLYTQPTRVTFP